MNHTALSAAHMVDISYGLQNIEACVEKYYGRAETTVADGYFELAVMLQKQE